jgi:hypothetical protein
MAGAGIGACGLIVAVVGTFLPWLSSGGVLRNSYAIVGIVGRLGLVGSGFGSTALSWWPLLGPVAMLAVIGGIVRWWRTAAVVALLFGLLTGVIGAGVLAVAGGHGAMGIALAYDGPVTTAIGGILAVAGSLVVLVASRRTQRSGLERNVPVSMEPPVHPSRLTVGNEQIQGPSSDDKSVPQPPHAVNQY